MRPVKALGHSPRSTNICHVSVSSFLTVARLELVLRTLNACASTGLHAQHMFPGLLLLGLGVGGTGLSN